jgi:CheY-specific phosphatase CheX
MHEDIGPEIIRIFGEVLEKQVFMFPEPIDAAEVVPSPETLCASSMTFTGKCRGGVLLAAPEALTRAIAANFLGTDEDDPLVEEHGRDSLGEILNVLCGHLVSALYGREEVFDLSVPRIFSLTGGEAAILARKKEFYAFDVEGHQVLLQASFCTGNAAVAPFELPSGGAGETPNAAG